MLYPSRLNALFGKPESLKSFLALLAADQEIAQQHHVVYVDYEHTKENAVERLTALGARPEDLVNYFTYFDSPPPELDKASTDKLQHLIDNRGPVTLAVFDGVTEAMALGDLDPNDGTDVVKFYRAAPHWFADKGAAVVMLDHVTKDKIGRGRWAIGSERKVSGIDGAAYTLETVTPFARGRTGKVTITVAKDRPGYVRQHEAQTHMIATFERPLLAGRQD